MSVKLFYRQIRHDFVQGLWHALQYDEIVMKRTESGEKSLIIWLNLLTKITERRKIYFYRVIIPHCLLEISENNMFLKKAS